MKSTTYNITGCTINALVVDINSYTQSLVVTVIADGRLSGIAIQSRNVNPDEPFHAHDAWFDVWQTLNSDYAETSLKVELASFFENRCKDELLLANKLLDADIELIAINEVY